MISKFELSHCGPANAGRRTRRDGQNPRASQGAGIDAMKIAYIGGGSREWARKLMLIRPLQAGALPPSIHSLIARHIANQEMIVQAALACDKEMAFHAVYNDPTSDLTVDRAWAMFNEMLR